MVTSLARVRPLVLVSVAALLLLAQATTRAGGPSPNPKAFTADLAIDEMHADPRPFDVAGTNIGRTVFFINNGPDAAGNAYVRLSTPAYTTFVSATTSSEGWILDSAPAVGGTGDIIFVNPTGPAAGQPRARFDITLSLDPAVPHYTTITTWAATYTTDPETTDPASANNTMSLARTAVTVEDPAEPNETPATAYPLPMGTSSGFLYSVGDTWDRDWYRFTIPPADAGKDLKVNVRVTSPYPSPLPANWSSDLDFSILDSSVTLKAMAMSSNDDETLYLHNVEAGDYYIYIDYSSTNYAEGNRFARYSISIETGTDFGVGYITGRVMLDGGTSGVAHAIVRGPVYPHSTANWHTSFTSVTTDGNGYFTLATTPGDHFLGITGDGNISVNNPEVNIVDEYYQDSERVQDAQSITVAPGVLSNLGTIYVTLGATISGQVTDMGGVPLDGVWVSSFGSTPTPEVSFTYTDPSGNYTLTRVPSPAARILFRKTNYGQEWYNDQPAFAPATILTTTPGGVMTGINAQLEVAGRVSGRVKDLLDHGLPATVTLYSTTDPFTPRASLVARVDTGAFILNNLKAGTYKLYVNPIGTSLGPQWFMRAAEFGSATPITVTAGVTTSGIDVVLVPPVSAGDFTEDLKSDVLWRHKTNGDMWLWAMDGVSNHVDYYVRTVAEADWEIRAVADFTGDQRPDLLWRNKSTGQLYLWSMDGAASRAEAYVGTVDTAYDIESYGDYNGDGKADLAWRAASGELWAWFMDGPVVVEQMYVGTVDPVYRIEASADFNGDGLCDVLWRGTAQGDVWIWLVQDNEEPIEACVGVVPDAGYQIAAAADFGGDGKADILWRHVTQGDVWLWTMDGETKSSEAMIGVVADTNYEIVSTGDYNGDFATDILWWNSANGEVWVWLMDGPYKIEEALIGIVPDTDYRVVR